MMETPNNTQRTVYLIAMFTAFAKMDIQTSTDKSGAGSILLGRSKADGSSGRLTTYVWFDYAAHWQRAHELERSILDI
jgi:hypothetical protein